MHTRRMFLRGFFLLGIISLWGGTLQAEPEIEVGLNPSGALKVGETCELTVEVTWKSAEGEYVFPKPEVALERLAMEDLGESSETFQKDGEEWKKKTFRFVLRAVLPGKGRIDSFRVDYVDSAKQLGGHFDIEPWEVKVSPDRSRLYRGLGVGLGALSAGGILAWMIALIFRRRRKKTEESVEAPLEESYLAQLSGLREELKEGRKGREALFDAARIFRGYLGRKFSIANSVGTTEEMLRELNVKVSIEEIKALKKLFERLDERRYAISEGSARGEEPLLVEMIRYVEGKKVIGIPA